MGTEQTTAATEEVPAARRAELASRLAAVRQRIADACAAAGRGADEVALMAVTKTVSAGDVGHTGPGGGLARRWRQAAPISTSVPPATARAARPGPFICPSGAAAAVRATSAIQRTARRVGK